jgi:ketosteroid isomerase-like protein
MTYFRPLLLVAALLSSPATRAADGDSLQAEIAVADGKLFAAIFDNCEASAVSAMVTDDFEFFHDKWGQIAKSRDEFVKAIQGGCDRQRQGTDFKAERRLVPNSLVVYPMKGYGALEVGEHEFFRLEADGRKTPTEHARFTQLWRFQSGKWMLARVISYAHVEGPRPGTQAMPRVPSEGSR